MVRTNTQAAHAQRDIHTVDTTMTSTRSAAQPQPGSPAERGVRLLATVLIATAVLILGCATPPAPSPVRHSAAIGAPAPAAVTNAPAVAANQVEPATPPPTARHSWRKWTLAADVEPREWNYIVVHHSASDAGSAAAFDRHHREVNGWDGLGYHFVIGNGNGSADGLIEIGFRWPIQREGAHAGSTEHNQHGIGICLVGNFDRDQPTAAQMDALVELSADLLARFDIPLEGVIRHCECKQGVTHCPGKTFPWFEYLRQLRKAVYTTATAAHGTGSAGSRTNAGADLDLLMPQ